MPFEFESSRGIPASYVVWKDETRDITYADDMTGQGKNFYNQDSAWVLLNALTILQGTGSGSVFAKKGTYFVPTTSPGIMPGGAVDKIALIGEPGGGTVLKLADGGVARQIINKGTAATNLLFQDLVFDGNKANVADAATRVAGQLININSGTGNDNIVFRNCVVKNTRHGAGMDLAGRNVKLLNNTFLDNGQTGSAFTSDHVHFGAVTDSAVHACYFNNCSDVALAQDNCQDVSVSDCTFIDALAALITVGLKSTLSTGFHIANCHFEEKTLDGKCVYIDDFGGSGAGDDITFTNCSFINLQPSTLDDLCVVRQANRVTFSNCTFRSTQTGTALDALEVGDEIAMSKVVIVGCVFDMGSAGNRGVRCQSLTDFTIANNIFRDASGICIFFTGNVSDKGEISGNIFDNIVTPFSFGITPTNTSIRNNRGYNPQGTASITVTASPFTYTAGLTPEAIYVRGGTVSDISKNATTIFAASPATVWLEPGEAVVVTYSSAPTMVKDRK